MPARPLPADFPALRPALAGRVLSTSDADLLDRYARAGDEAAFELLVWRHGRLVWGVCRRVTRDHAAAEDAFQAAFLALARKAGTVAHADGVAGWLYRVAYRAAVGAARGAPKRTGPLDGVEVADPAPGPAEAAGWRDAGRAVAEEVSRLPDAYRASFVLCEVQGLSNAQAAAALGCAVGTVESRLTRARARLRQRLTARGVTVAGGVVLGGAVPDAVLAAGVQAGVGTVPARVATLAGRACRSGVGLKLTAAAAALLVAGSALVGMTAGEPPAPPAAPEPPAAVADGPAVRFGPTKFRAGAMVADARYLPGGKQVVGLAGAALHVWDAADGSPVMSLNVALDPLDDHEARGGQWRACAAHPTKRLVALGGTRAGGRNAGKAVIQLWDLDAGQAVAEAVTTGDTLKALAWTPDGSRLLERSNVGRSTPQGTKPTGWKLTVRDDRLGVVKAHDLPQGWGEWQTVLRPLPGGTEALVWQGQQEPTVIDLDSGRVVRALPFKPDIPSDLAVSPDGQTVLATSSREVFLFPLAGGDAVRKFPVLRKDWEMHRPLFSPDGKTLYVYDFRPMAYDVATGKEKWRARPRTMHGVAVHLCDVAPDGSSVLVRHGQSVALLDPRTGEERDIGAGPSSPASLTWSPDGSTVFTRVDEDRAWNADRTWTAWDPATGRPRYVPRPTGLVDGEDWKFMPDLFFPPGGREVVAGLVRAESAEMSGQGELLVFDLATGKALRRLGNPLPLDRFRWAYPVALAADGGSVLMRDYAMDPAQGPRYKAAWWDPVKNAPGRRWTVEGSLYHPIRDFERYDISVIETPPVRDGQGPKPPPAVVRCYSLADGAVAAELTNEFGRIEPVAVRGPLLLGKGYDRTLVTRGFRGRYQPQPPFAHDIWELPTRGRVRAFELPALVPVAFAPGGGYVLRVAGDRTFEVYEPFVLKAVVATVPSPARVHGFAFAPDGGRVAASLEDTTLAVWDAAGWRAKIDEQLAKQVPADLGPLWDDLAKDTAAGLRAARLIGAAADKGVTFLAGKVAPKMPADAATVKKLIADLGAEAFADREKAEKGLRALGPQAGPLLRAAAGANPSAEVGRRIAGLLRALDARTLTADEVREVRAVQALAWADTPAARALRAKWAAGDPGAVLTKAAAGAVVGSGGGVTPFTPEPLPPLPVAPNRE